MPSVEPTLKAAIVRSAVVVAAFVGGVVIFAPAPSRAPASLGG